MQEWNSYFDQSGFIKVPISNIKERIFHGNFEPNVRKEGWKYLLKLYPWNSSSLERINYRKVNHDVYKRYKKQWQDKLASDSYESAELKENLFRIGMSEINIRKGCSAYRYAVLCQSKGRR